MRTLAPKLPPVTLEGRVLKETAAALLLEHKGADIWFPLSQIHSVHRAPEESSEQDYIVVEHWIAAKKGLV